MRIGLIGVGRIGIRHARVLRDLAPVQSVIVADAEPARAFEVARSLEIEALDTVSDLFAEGLDGVVITAPTPAHAGLVRLACEARVPVFCEKPLASDIGGTREVIRAVDAAGIPLHMGFQRRFDPAYRIARERLLAGGLGRLHTIWACTMDAAPPHPSYIPSSGGIFRDCSVHDFDAIRWATGREVVEVYATGTNNVSLADDEKCFVEAGDVDTAQAILTLDDGTLATVVASRYNGGGYEGRLELHGSRGTAVAGLEGVREVSYLGFADRFAEAYAAELEAFVDVIAGERESPCTGRDALAALLIAEACEASRAEHFPVRLEGFA